LAPGLALALALGLPFGPQLYNPFVFGPGPKARVTTPSMSTLFWVMNSIPKMQSSPPKVETNKSTFLLLSQPHFGINVRMKLTPPKVGSWNPLGLLQTQSLSSRSKHLASRCSLYQWKGLEMYMPKMASHVPFGHLQPKLWAKEGPGVKLVV